jgi:mediator of RNA polymerase II transcription subunit 7
VFSLTVQARENLENMMLTQLNIRKQETASIHEKCDVLETTITALRESAKTSVLVKEEDTSITMVGQT